MSLESVHCQTHFVSLVAAWESGTDLQPWHCLVHILVHSLEHSLQVPLEAVHCQTHFVSLGAAWESGTDLQPWHSLQKFNYLILR